MLCSRELLTVLFLGQVFPQILLSAFLSFLICGHPPASDTNISSHHLLLYALEAGECLFCGKADIRNPLRYLLMNAVASRSVSGSFQLPLT